MCHFLPIYEGAAKRAGTAEAAEIPEIVPMKVVADDNVEGT
jgi:hypothetical protein